LLYEIEENKHEIEESNNRIKRSGKEGEAEITRLSKDNGALRNELKDNDNRNRTRIIELTSFYDNQFKVERETGEQRETNQRQFYEHEIEMLNNIIAAKEEEIKRLLKINKDLKRNEEDRLEAIRGNNQGLKDKLEEVVLHYEREVELMKIKLSHLYEADLESLKSKLENSYANHTLEVDNLRKLLKETRERLADEVQDRLDLRKDYELRLTEIGISHDRIQKELKNVIGQRDKELEGHTSKASLTHIEHNQLLERRHLNEKQMMAEKRNLEGKINSKNKELETLNLKIQQMLGLHKREVEKAEKELEEAKQEYSRWLERQEQETGEWQAERNELNDKIESLKKQVDKLKRDHQGKENELTEDNNQKGIENAKLKGLVEELENKVTHLESSNRVEAGNIEKTMFDNTALMNAEKEKLQAIVAREREHLQTENDRVRRELDSQLADLNKENDLLRDNYRKAQIREEELREDVRGLTGSVEQKSKLEESVINIVLSNNYFKNVAEIFKRQAQ
jgi:chromosome segregation ATPase